MQPLYEDSNYSSAKPWKEFWDVLRVSPRRRSGPCPKVFLGRGRVVLFYQDCPHCATLLTQAPAPKESWHYVSWLGPNHPQCWDTVWPSRRRLADRVSLPEGGAYSTGVRPCAADAWRLAQKIFHTYGIIRIYLVCPPNIFQPVSKMMFHYYFVMLSGLCYQYSYNR